MGNYLQWVWFLRQPTLDWLPSLIDINIPVGFHLYSSHFFHNVLIYISISFICHTIVELGRYCYIWHHPVKGFWIMNTIDSCSLLFQVVMPYSNTYPSHNTWHTDIFLTFPQPNMKIKILIVNGNLSSVFFYSCKVVSFVDNVIE